MSFLSYLPFKPENALTSVFICIELFNCAFFLTLNMHKSRFTREEKNIYLTEYKFDKHFS